MIVKKFTYREVCRALGLELMKLRWEYRVKLKHAAHLAGMDFKKADAAEIGRGVGERNIQRLLRLYDTDINIELIRRNPEKILGTRHVPTVAARDDRIGRRGA